MKSVCVAIFLVLHISGALGGQCERHGAQCPDYTVIKTYDEYEERSYPSLVWISATQRGKSKREVTRGLIKTLYDYLGGGNNRGEVLDMMVPVRTAKVSHGSYNTYTMSIALKPEHSKNPPTPTNPNVTVEREPEKIYVARSFGGQIRQESVWDREAEILKNAVANKEGVDTSFYYICVYDSPWQETDRLNEVWMVKN